MTLTPTELTMLARLGVPENALKENNMQDTITIPRPVVPHGPHGMTEDEATAHYLRKAIEKIDSGFVTVGGSNVTNAVRSLLIDCARALEGKGDAAPEPEWEYGHEGDTLIGVHANASRAQAVKDAEQYLPE